MAINLPSARLAFVAGLAIFICISFVLYNFVDSSASIRTNVLKRNIDSIETLRAKVDDLQAKLQRNEELVKDFKGRLGRYQEIGKAHEAVESDNGQGAQIPQPQENNRIPVNFNVSGAQQCPVGQVVSDIQMLDVYDSIPFDNPNGGVWKQGFEIKYDKENIKSQKRLEVIVIPHSHCDPGWLKTFEGYYEEQTKNILDGMVKNLGEMPDMKFIYAEMSFFELWWSQQAQDTKEKVRGYLQSGQLEIVTGGWVMTDEANAHLYSIVMELFEGHEFLQTQLNFKPRSHWSIDPFGLSSVLAHVMKSANLTHMAVQRVHYSIKKYLAERKQLEFRWRQLFAGNSARTDIRTHMFPFYSYDVPHTCGPDPSICCQFDFRRLTSYGCPWGKPPKRITNNNVAARAELLADQYRKKAQLYDLNVLLIPLGDDFRYDTQSEWTDQYENYKKLFAYMNEKSELNINAKFGTLNDYFQLMDKRLSEQPETPKQDLPVLSGDFFTYADRDDHYWSGYFTSRPFYKHMDRTVGHFVRAADILFSFSNWKANKNNEEMSSIKQLYNRLMEARRSLSLFQHHDGVTGTARKDVVIDYGKKMLKAIEDSKTIISQTTAYLFGLSEQSKQQIKMNTEHFLDLLPKKKPIEPISTILIQNSLGFERNEIHCIAVKSPKIKIRKSENSEDPKQQIQPILIVKDGKITTEKDQLELCFVANIPALGISRYELVQGEDNGNLVKIQASGGVETSDFSPFEATKFDGEILLSNEKTSATFDSNTGLLKSVKPKDDVSFDMNMEFVFYGARGKNRSRDPGGDSLSGAYLFLPNGKAKPLENSKNSFVKVSGPVRQSIHILGPQEAQILQEIRLDLNEEFLDIINHVDVTTQSNFEVAMRLKSTDFADNEEFYTELNAQQMIRRKRYEKIPLQGNFYPMPGAAFLQTKEKRWSLLGRQALGVASLEPGWMEVMLDRRLDQDDDRGLAEDVHDNKLTESRFRLLIEKTPSQSSTDSKKIDFHSVRAHHYSLKLHYPLISMSLPLDESAAKSLPSEWKPLKTDLPCDVHLLAFRNFGEKTVYSNGNRNTIPKNQGALILQRLGIGCDGENVEGKCKPSNGKLLLTDYLVDSPKKASPTSLTSMDELHSVNGLQVQLEPFDLKTVRIEF